MRFSLLSIAIMSAIAIRSLVEPATGQEKAAVAPQDADAGNARGAKQASENADVQNETLLLRAAREHVRSLELRSLDEEGQTVEIVERPLLSYGEPARGNSHGTLWAFGPDGRPAAFLELFQSAVDPSLWFQSLTRSGDERLAFQCPNGPRWLPPADLPSRPTIDKAPPPADGAAGRLRQLKSLSKRFTAHEIWDPDNSRFELRLLVQPVHRYGAPQQGIQDGAAFVFANGTNPELVVLIEALGPTLEKSNWRYSPVPTSSAELHLEIDGREAWNRPRAPDVVGRPTDDYWMFTLPVENTATDGDR